VRHDHRPARAADLDSVADRGVSRPVGGRACVVHRKVDREATGELIVATRRIVPPLDHAVLPRNEELDVVVGTGAVEASKVRPCDMQREHTGAQLLNFAYGQATAARFVPNAGDLTLHNPTFNILLIIRIP